MTASIVPNGFLLRKKFTPPFQTTRLFQLHASTMSLTGYARARWHHTLTCIKRGVVPLGFRHIDIRLSRFDINDPLASLTPVMEPDHVDFLKKACAHIRIADDVRHYIIQLCAALRDHPNVAMGPSPRASLGLQASARAKALICGRHYVLPDDVKYLALSILAHRLVLDTHSRLKGTTEQQLVRDVLESVPVPV